MQHFKKLFTKALALFAVVILAGAMATAQATAWFGAGRTPGWVPTTLGLSAEIALPDYKFSPDFYTLGNNVGLNTRVFNPHSTPVTFNAYLVVSRVIEAPLGENVTDGDPDNPGLNENQLYDFHQANNDSQTVVYTQSLGSFTVPANGEITIPASFTPATTGYFQFDITHRDPALAYEHGNILTAGFIRVLAGAAQVEPSPTPVVTPTPDVTPTPTPTPSTGGTGGTTSGTNRRTSLIVDLPSCNASQFKAIVNLNSNDESEIKNRTVNFKYRDITKTAQTNQSGGAEATFDFTQEADVEVWSEGFASTSFRVTRSNTCTSSNSSNGSVLGASTDNGATGGTTAKRGKVLGASTLAATGSGINYSVMALAVSYVFLSAVFIKTLRSL